MLRFHGTLIAASMCFVAPAMAADPVFDPAPIVAPAPVFDWSGIYVGGQLGYGWGEADSVYTDDYSPTDIDLDGFLGGVHVGYNHQFGNFLVGVEGDLLASAIDGSAFDAGSGYSMAADIDWIASVRARLGATHGRFLFFATAGVAWADINHSISDGTTTSFSEVHTGWTAGAGVEYAVNSQFSVRGEYRYFDFGDETYPATNGWLPHEFDTTLHTFMLGASFHF